MSLTVMINVCMVCVFVTAGEPKFLSARDKLQSVNVTEGDQVRLPCRVSAEPLADITWLRNGEPLDCKSFIITSVCFDTSCAIQKRFKSDCFINIMQCLQATSQRHFRLQ